MLSQSQIDVMGQVAPGFSPVPQAQPTEFLDPEIARLRSTNSLYGVYRDDWKDYLTAYEGGSEVFSDRYLAKHARETQADYQDRLRRLHYLNYCAPLVDFFTNFIFTETIHRDGGKDEQWYQDFIKNVNRKGEDITSFMSAVSDDVQIFGMSWQMVDAPSFNPEDVTRQHIEDNNITPYWVLIKPLEMLDWVTDEFDNIIYAKRQQIVEQVNSQGYRGTFEKYTEFTAEVWKVTYVDVSDITKPTITSVEIIPNRLGKVNLQVTRFKKSKRYLFMGNSFLRDFARNNFEVMNLTSLLQEFLYKQAFNILAKESDSTIPYMDGNNGDLGTSNVLEYPKGADAPAYISPPADPAEFIQGERQRIINEMFRLAAQDVVNELFNGEKSSGFSQAQQFSKTVPFIATRADILERSENNLMQMTMQFLQKSWSGAVKYKDRYELTNLTDAITQLTSIFRDLQMPSETFLKEELKRLVAEFDGKISPDKMTSILGEIDALDFDKWAETQKEALVGASQSPADQQKPKSTGTMAEAAAEAKTKTGATKKLKKK